MKKSLIAAGLMLFSTTANAHYLWIEQPAKGNAIIHFGEYNEGVIEHSPGRMDEMPSIEAFAGAVPLSVMKEANQFRLSARAGGEAVTAQELDYPVKDWRANGIGLAKPVFYARFGASSKPTLDLDIILAADGKSAQIFLHGKPLSSAAFSFHAPNGWSQSGKADKEGKISIAMPWRGQHLVEVIELEKAPGTYQGAAYDVVRHRATLTLMQPRGVPTFAVPLATHHE
jgi:uncharacterized GH25 family protein